MGTNVLVVDDHPTTRLGLRAALAGEEDVSVVGEAGDLETALCLVGELGPDVVLSEAQMGGEMAGVCLCRELKETTNPPRVLIHTARNSCRDVCLCYMAGADGFVHKGEQAHRLVDAVRQVDKGKRVWLLGGKPQEVVYDPGVAVEDLLTQKEEEVLALVLEGYSNARIAEELCLSCNTVKTHLAHVYRKLGVSGRKDFFSTGEDVGVGNR